MWYLELRIYRTEKNKKSDLPGIPNTESVLIRYFGKMKFAENKAFNLKSGYRFRYSIKFY